MKKWALNSLFVLAALVSFGQKNNYRSTVQSPDSSGFYKILLSRDILAQATSSYNDIRLIDKDHKPVPYLLETEKEFTTHYQFHEFPIASIQKGSDGLTYYIINNNEKKPVSVLILQITNTQANRSFNVSGSNDSTQWFAIKENIQVDNKNESSSYFTQEVILPKTSYAYYKILVNGKNLSPFNIIKAGINEAELGQGTYHELPDPFFTLNVNEGFTKIDLSFNGNHVVDQLKFDISAPKYFSRKVDIYDPESDNAYLGGFTLSSNKENTIPLRFKGGKIRIEIEDNDNPILTIDGIYPFQLNRYLLAYLEKENSYTITFGDSSARAPQYDLSYFSDSISANSPLLTTNAIENIPPDEIKSTDSKKDNWLLWTVIAIVLVILLFITRKMAGEVKNK